MTEYKWREHTAEGTRHFRAARFARQWKVETRLKDEEFWSRLVSPFDLAVLRTLRDLLWAKYQRRKLPFEVVHEIDSLLPADERRTTDEKGGGLTSRAAKK